MSQIFNLRLAMDTSDIDAKQLGTTVEQLQRIRINVSATVVQQPESHLLLTYQIQLPHTSLASRLNWPIWQQSQIGFSDYLWEQTCLECFIATKVIDNKEAIENNSIDNSAIDTVKALNNNEATGYIEINASPSGRYALYQFNRYRNPSTLPPMPLLKMGGRTRAHINWADSSAKQQIFSGQTFYELSFGVPLAQLSNQPSCSSIIAIERLHPCVILWFGVIALYFAPNHASPPDFHKQRYWSNFDDNAALDK